MSFDDGGDLNRLIADLTRASARAQVRATKKVQHFGVILQGRVKARAAGRPGPRMQTGDYNRSIGLRVGIEEGGVIAASVGTNRPQGRRLEFGFHGVDSLGRRYDQPPFPHFGPALDETAPEFVKAMRDLGADLLDGRT